MFNKEKFMTNYYKYTIQVLGIKKKQQLSKQHSFMVANYSSMGLDDALIVAKGVIESNMKDASKAVLMGYKAYCKDNSYIEYEKHPSLTIEV